MSRGITTSAVRRPTIKPRRRIAEGTIMANLLYYGDNLEWLRNHSKFPDESVDLVYLDPPFNSSATYNMLFREHDGTQAVSQQQAFEDTWSWNEESARAYEEVCLSGGQASELLRGFHRMWSGQPGKGNNMLAYLSMMAARLIELHRVLKPTGSIYLHCDPTASHYLKTVMDCIFGAQNYRNELVWKRANAHNDPKRYGRIADVLFFYTKSNDYVWNTQYTPYRADYYKSHFTLDENGRYFRTVPLDAPRHGDGSPGLLYEWKGKLPAASRTWAIKREIMEEYEAQGRLRYTRTGTPTLLQYADDMPGVPLQSIWTDIPPVNPQARERLGYPTQKPIALLERIIQASSNEGDVILDPFCGCGTAIAAAEKLNRDWIGIDITYLAIPLIKQRLLDTFGDLPSFVMPEVFGAPASLNDALRLAQNDKYQFQFWIVDKVLGPSAMPHKKGSDGGIDGILYFVDGPGEVCKGILQVKAGENVGVNAVQQLDSVVRREDAALGCLITVAKPTRNMISEAASMGFYKSNQWGSFPRLQILTLEQIMNGETIKCPPQHFRLAHRRAPKNQTELGKEAWLPLQLGTTSEAE